MISRISLLPMVITNADVTGDLFPVSESMGFAIQADWPAGLVGTLNVQATINGVTWPNVPGTIRPVNGAGGWMWNFDGQHYDQVRLFFTYTSGSGTIAVHGQRKS